MRYVCDLSRNFNVTPVLTFDQALFMKATNIINLQHLDSYLKKIVLRLGAFHTEMSTICHVMGSFRLNDLLEEVYLSHAVVHMQTGKAVQRAEREHFW
jgi:hypothetical protein